MKRTLITALCLCLLLPELTAATKKNKVDLWPDGTEISEWFHQVPALELKDLGKQYKLTDYHILPDGKLYTSEIQALIDEAAAQGGGVIVVPPGVFMTGGLHFKQGVHLYLAEGAVLRGSDNIADYPLGPSRIEGECCTYFGALINADGLDGFTICGSGTIDGNGQRYHQAFWLRRKWNPKCTNKDEQRPRLVFVSHSRNVRIEGVHLQNSAFWTTHFYDCENVRVLGCRIYSLCSPSDLKGPSTDAIDLDVVSNVLVKNCYMEVNDDAVVLKGGKGPWAHDPAKSVGNGHNTNVLIEDCTYGTVHGCLTMGSESVFNHNIILRRIEVSNGYNLLWLKMRPDTEQRYEYVTVEDVHGHVRNFITVRPWTQFYDLKDRQDTPMSYSNHIVMRNCEVDCDCYFNVGKQTDQYLLSDFRFENLKITTRNDGFDPSCVDGFELKNVEVSLTQPLTPDDPAEAGSSKNQSGKVTVYE